MGTELEWKYELPEAVSAEAILAWDEVRTRMCEAPRSIRMRTCYYDTPDRQLSCRRITLRRRMENERSVVCCKAPVPGAADPRLRGEWELEAEAPDAVLPALVRLGAPTELAAASPLVPVCGAEFLRTAVLLRFADGSAAELALDGGSLFASDASVPLRELELELKDGAPAEPRAFAEALAAHFALRPQPLSKFARASALNEAPCSGALSQDAAESKSSCCTSAENAVK